MRNALRLGSRIRCPCVFRKQRERGKRPCAAHCPRPYGFRDVAAIAQAYHGHLSSLIAISSYKFDGKGGEGRPAHVHIVPTPDPYRHSGSADDHATLLRRTLAAASDGVAAFMAESAMGCAGQVFFLTGISARHSMRPGKQALYALPTKCRQGSVVWGRCSGPSSCKAPSRTS